MMKYGEEVSVFRCERLTKGDGCDSYEIYENQVSCFGTMRFGRVVLQRAVNRPQVRTVTPLYTYYSMRSVKWHPEHINSVVRSLICSVST